MADPVPTEAGRFPRPLRNRVLVKELPPEQTTPSGLIHIPDQAKGVHEQNWRALVIAVGPGKAEPKVLKRLERWLDRALQAFEGNPDPSEIEGKHLHTELLDGMDRGWGADVKPGDIVVVSKYIHTEVRVGDEMCRIVAATDILAVLEEQSDERVGEQCRELVRRVLGPTWTEPTVVYEAST